jgi:hypothetical protein
LQSRIDRTGTTHVKGSKANRSFPSHDPAAKSRLDDIEEQNKLALAFERRYQMHRFPTFVEDPNIFEGLCIFTKKRDEDT